MEIQPIIANITEVAGVNGAAVFDDSGNCLGHQLFPPYEPILLWETLRELRGATDCYAGVGVGEQASDTLLVFEHGKVFSRRVEPFELVALTSTTANLVVLAVAFNVASLRLHQGLGGPWPARGGTSPGIPMTGNPRDWPSARHELVGDTTDTHHSHGPHHGVSRSSTTSSSQGFASAPPYNPPSYSGPMAVSQSSRMSWSQTSNARVAGAVGVKVMRHLLTVTQRYFGQEAQGILERELRKLGATPQTLTSANFADVIRSVSRLLGREHRDAYIAEVLGDGHRR